MKAFYFDVESEIAHFRDPLSHSFLNSFLSPPSHTIIGFLGCCSGFSENETETEINNNILVGCKMLSLKGYLKDLVIMRNYKNNQNIGMPRMRKFLVNPKYRIYVASEDEDKIKKIRYQVNNPIFTPYLGISDCIAYIRYISDILDAKSTKIKEIECNIFFQDKDHTNNNYNNYNDNSIQIEYSTRVKKDNALVVYPQIVRSPKSYEITENGRKPQIYEKVLMSLNCIIKLKKDFNGFVIDDEKVSLI